MDVFSPLDWLVPELVEFRRRPLPYDMKLLVVSFSMEMIVEERQDGGVAWGGRRCRTVGVGVGDDEVIEWEESDVESIDWARLRVGTGDGDDNPFQMAPKRPDRRFSVEEMVNSDLDVMDGGRSES